VRLNNPHEVTEFSSANRVHGGSNESGVGPREGSVIAHQSDATKFGVSFWSRWPILHRGERLPRPRDRDYNDLVDSKREKFEQQSNSESEIRNGRVTSFLFGLTMNDLFAINTAKSEYRDAFNFGDVNRIRAIADPDIVVFQDGEPSAFGMDGLDELSDRLKNLFERFTAKLAVIVMEIRLDGNSAHAYGWHDLKLTPKDGGGTIQRRSRYMDVWRKNKQGNWKLLLHIDNRDVPDPFQPENHLPRKKEAIAAHRSC
jgi:ketosteroid isomerase-like protein